MKGRERGNPIPVKPLVTSLFILFIDFFVESNMENVMSLNIMVACKKIIYTEVDQFLPFPVFQHVGGDIVQQFELSSNAMLFLVPMDFPKEKGVM
jgi:hypothetical protein